MVMDSLRKFVDASLSLPSIMKSIYRMYRHLLHVAIAFAPLSALASPLGFGGSPRDTVPTNAVSAPREAPQLEVLAEAVSDTAVLRGTPDRVIREIDSDMSSLYFEDDVSGAPILQWDERMVAFDTVVRGESREHTYRFENVGSVPATIAIASACTCTTLSWTRGEIAPGGQGVVHAVFDSSEKSAGELIVIDVILEESAPSGNGIVEQIGYTFEIAPAH